MITHVGIVDDDSRFHRMLSQDMSIYSDIHLCLVAGSGTECLQQLAHGERKEHPEVLLVDIDMPGLSGIETVEQISERYPEIRCIMFTVVDHDEKILASILAGAMGYILKTESAGFIYKAILEVRAGGSLLSPMVAKKVCEMLRERKNKLPGNQSDTGGGELLSYLAEGITYPEAENMVREYSDEDAVHYFPSRTELKIINLLAQGYSSKEIAGRLYNSLHTINTHRRNILSKSGASSTIELINRAKERKWLQDNLL